MSTLEQRVKELESQVAWMRTVLESQGISLWMQTRQAAATLGVSRDFLLDEISRSRLNPKDSDFREGIHFRHIGKGGAVRPSWQINIVEAQKIFSTPIERRKGA